MTPQHIWTWPVILTMCISVLALAVAGGSLTWQIVSWRRSGPRVSVKTMSGVGGPARGIWFATSGQHLTTQGGNTLDNGAGGVVITGGTLDGVTIGATTPAVSVNANTLANNAWGVTLSNTQQPWLNQAGGVQGSLTGGGNINQLIFADSIVGNANYICGLMVYDDVLSPAVGPRCAIQGEVLVTSIGTSTKLQAQFVGVHGLATTSANLGGTAIAPIGEFFGGWFQATTHGGTYHDTVFGVEIDVYVESDQVLQKVGCRVQTNSTDTTRGTIEDAAVQVIKGTGADCPAWRNGIIFGSNQAGSSNPSGTSSLWPFASDSTIIGTSVIGNGLPANIGIDFSNVTFSDSALKTGAAPITMSEMASAPARVSGVGKLYVASDGSLHYRGPTTDTQLAPA